MSLFSSCFLLVSLLSGFPFGRRGEESCVSSPFPHFFGVVAFFFSGFSALAAPGVPFHHLCFCTLRRNSEEEEDGVFSTVIFRRENFTP